MFAMLITLTPGHRNESIDCHTAKVLIMVLPIMAVKTQWNSTMEWLEQAQQSRKDPREWLNNAKYSDYRLLFTTEDKLMIVKYIMKVLSPFR